MLVFLVILSTILLVLLTVSVIGNILFWKAAERQMALNELYVNWISEWRSLVFKTYTHMKLLDEKQMFEKDDDVGIIFQDMNELIENLNDKTEENIEEEGE